MDKQINVNASFRLFTAVRERSDEEEIPVSHVITSALRQWIAGEFDPTQEPGESTTEEAPKDKRVTADVSEEFHEEVFTHKRRTGIDVSVVVRRALHRWVTGEYTPPLQDSNAGNHH